MLKPSTDYFIFWVFACTANYKSYICNYLFPVTVSGIILGMDSADERQRYNVMLSLIGWAHTQNDPCILVNIYIVFSLLEGLGTMTLKMCFNGLILL